MYEPCNFCCILWSLLNTEDNWKACIWEVVFLIPNLKSKFSSPDAFEITEANEYSASQNLSMLLYILQSRSSVP